MAAQCEAKNCLVAVASQAGPPVQDNPVWGYHELQDEPEIFFDYASRVRAPASAKQAARDRKRLSPSQWEMFWGNSWGAKGRRLLEQEDVDACVHDYSLPSGYDQVQRLLREQFDTELDRMMHNDKAIAALSGGLDRAMNYMRADRGDRTIWATIARTTDSPARYVVVQLDILGEDLTDEDLAMMSEQERSQAAASEVLQAAWRAATLGAGVHIIEQYQGQDLVGHINGATLRHMTTPRKVGLYNTLGELVRQHRLIVPASRPLLREELLAITVDTSKTNTPKFEAKPHDDTIDGILNALDGVLPTDNDEEPTKDEQMALEDMMPGFQRVAAGAAGHGLDMRRPDLAGGPVRAGAAAL
jgi:hypothetical protein